MQRRKVMQNRETKKIVGTVKSVSISGIGQNSAQLVLVVVNKNEQMTLTVRSLPAHEPQVFVSVANFVTTAYWNKKTIGVEFLPLSDSGNVADVVGVYVPA